MHIYLYPQISGPHMTFTNNINNIYISAAMGVSMREVKHINKYVKIYIYVYSAWPTTVQKVIINVPVILYTQYYLHGNKRCKQNFTNSRGDTLRNEKSMRRRVMMEDSVAIRMRLFGNFINTSVLLLFHLLLQLLIIAIR